MRYIFVIILALCPAVCCGQYSPLDRIADSLENASTDRLIDRMHADTEAMHAREEAKYEAAMRAQAAAMTSSMMQNEIVRLRVLVSQMEADRIKVLQAVADGDDAWLGEWLNALSKSIRSRKKYTFEVTADQVRARP